MSHKKDENKTTICISMDQELLDRLDSHVELMKRRLPGIRITRAGVIRMFVLKGLDAEKEK